jgi:predicted glycosyltransferase involved in capsule biosynthesis
VLSVVITIKNRNTHLVSTFPSVVTQEPDVPFEVVYIDYASDEDVGICLQELIAQFKDLFSERLVRIKRVALEGNDLFNSGKAKNLAVPFLDPTADVISFSDVDVFLGMDYHRHWIPLVRGNNFYASRVQETTAQASRRLSPKINYGNMIVERKSFVSVGGFDEEILTWGGEDDDIIHRLKISGLREINPHSFYDARHTSIVHGDDLRFAFLESQVKSAQNTQEKFNRIYEKSDPLNRSFLRFYNDNIKRLRCEVSHGA